MNVLLIACQYPILQFGDIVFPLDYCTGFASDVQVSLQLISSWVLYIVTAIAIIQMVLKSIFGIAPLFGMMESHEAEDEGSTLTKYRVATRKGGVK